MLFKWILLVLIGGWAKMLTSGKKSMYILSLYKH